jgi:hypothetical protein
MQISRLYRRKIKIKIMKNIKFKILNTKKYKLTPSFVNKNKGLINKVK